MLFGGKEQLLIIQMVDLIKIEADSNLQILYDNIESVDDSASESSLYPENTTVNLKFFNYNNQKNSKETLIITEDEDIQDEKYFKKLYYNLPISITKKESTEESSTDSSNS